jgi:hypothetical protein
VLVAVAVRGLIPMGWMPTGERGFEITICAGVDTHKVWLDSDGKLHQQDPSKKPVPDLEPCAFGALAMAAVISDIGASDIPPAKMAVALGRSEYLVSIGRGLAAPPPPATGPPILT